MTIARQTLFRKKETISTKTLTKREYVTQKVVFKISLEPNVGVKLCQKILHYQKMTFMTNCKRGIYCVFRLFDVKSPWPTAIKIEKK